MDINTILLPMLSLGGMGLIFGLGLGYAGVKLKVDEDERIPLVRDLLPGANCGGCGFAGCDAFAAAVVNGSAKPNGCPVGGASVAEKVSEAMGVSTEGYVRQCAFVKCAGCAEKTRDNYEYTGLEDCTAMSHLAAGGPKSCTYGCVGGGSCVRACMFDAINIIDGIAVVDNEKCTACGMCVQACPKSLISLIPYDKNVRVACNSRDNGKITKANCDVGCIGCKLCVKACDYDAIEVENLLAEVKYDKCTRCGECVKKCPTKAIKE